MVPTAVGSVRRTGDAEINESSCFDHGGNTVLVEVTGGLEIASLEPIHWAQWQVVQAINRSSRRVGKRALTNPSLLNHVGMPSLGDGFVDG